MIKIRTLPNGVRVATDSMDNVRSCTIGLWLEIGSRYEEPKEVGLTHFIEHMLFKGTPRHDALQLADELNRLGGNFNAHTGQETLCLHARCVDVKAPAVLDLLSEMLLESTFPKEEIGRERNVILEEYRMYEDNPDDQVFDLFFKALWPNSSLGRPILGTPATIKNFSADAIKKYLGREFEPSRILVVLAGHYDSDECNKIIKKRFSSLAKPAKTRKPSSGRTPSSANRAVAERQVEQVHFCFGMPGPPRGSEDRFDFGLLNMVLGGGMSSRLFKEVREKRGLVYNIQSFSQPFHGAGCFGIAGSTGPDTYEEVLQLSLKELRLICEEKVAPGELELAKEQLLDSILLSVESTSARMSHLSESIMTYGRYVKAEEIVKGIEQVTPAGVLRAARKYLRGRPMAGAFIGPKGSPMKKLFDSAKLN